MRETESEILNEPAPGRDERRAAVLAAAAREFNAAGVSRASFARIADDVGLTRAALYYYVKDRQDMVVQCYRHACEVVAADLAAAQAEGATGHARLIAYVRRALDPYRDRPAILSELDFLTGAAKAEIAAAHDANVGWLRGLVRSGVADGSLRPCDDEAIAQAIVGLVSWIAVCADWVDDTDGAFRLRVVQAVVDLVSDGEAAEPDYKFLPPVRIEAFYPSPASAFDREAQADAKVEQLLMTASEIINRRGVDGASLTDITAALGATKGAFYHYLESKTDLLVRCHRRAMDLCEAFGEAAGRLGRNGLEKTLIGLYLNVQAQACGLAPLIQLAGAEALPPAPRREIRRRSQALHRLFSDYALEGLADGSIRNTDAEAMTLVAAGLVEWLPKWFDPSDGRSQGGLADQYCRLFIGGLRGR